MMASRKAVLDKNKQQLLDSVDVANKIYSNEELSILLDEVVKKQDDILNKAYPVGSIYISYNNTNPNSLFGGTWIAYGTGRTLVGVDTSQTEFNTIGKTGGEKTHTLSINEMPAHDHDFLYNNSSYQSWNFSGTSGQNITFYLGNSSGGLPVGINKRGGSQAHNNLQPYITVYMWRRTA